MDTKAGGSRGGRGRWDELGEEQKKMLGQSVPSLGSLLLGLKGDQFLSQCLNGNKQNPGTFIAMLSTM